MQALIKPWSSLGCRIVELLRKEEDCFYEGDLEHAYQ